MSQSNASSPLDHARVREWVESLIASGESNASIAKQVTDAYGTPTSERSIRRAKKRWGIAAEQGRVTPPEEPRFSQTNDDQAEIVGQATERLNTPEDLMRERGLDPDDWEVKNVQINEWNGLVNLKSGEALANSGKQKTKLRQLKISLVRKQPKPPFIEAARVDGPTYQRKRPTRSEEDYPRLVVLCGDQQAPFHNSHMHELFCEWLDYNLPDEGILIGDTVDFPDISRHRYNPETNATVQECVNTGYSILRDYREASPDTHWRKMPGNHDERVRNTLIDWSVELYGVTRAQVDEHPEEPPVLSIENLLRLDELGIDYVDPNGQYDQAQINLSKYLAARHGWIAVKGSGSSALKTLEHLGYSIVVGHTHRQSIVHKTSHSIDGVPNTLVGVETGCMCKLDGLGYSVAPDWQNGFATARLWDDGVFKMDLATYFDGVLVWGDQRYGEHKRKVA